MLRYLKQALRPTPQGCALALAAPQRDVQVQLLLGEHPVDVTDTCAVAALNPLMLRMESTPGAPPAAVASLRMIDRATGLPIGVLNLAYRRQVKFAETAIDVYEAVGGNHLCAGRLRRTWDTYLYRRAARKKPPAIMTPEAVEHIMVFYSCPRPVHFVSVDDGDNSNLFPMDLMGYLPSGLFTLALRNTSPSVQSMKISRRVVLGDVPASAIDAAYALGAHHKLKRIDWDSLPFETVRSQRFGLRAPAISLRLREVELLGFEEIGSHTLFLGRICSDMALNEGAQLFHSSGAYEAWRSRLGRPLATVRSSAPRSA